MIIYWDIVLVFNVLINFLILIVIQTLHQEKLQFKYLIPASLLGGGMIFTYLFNYQIFMTFKVLGGILIAGLAYLKNSFSKLLVKVSSFYIINFLLVGILCSFKINDYFILLIVLVFIIILIMLEANKRYYYFLRMYEYVVIISFDTIILKLRGYLDTGNFALSKDNEPIIFIDEDYYKPEMIPISKFELETLNNQQVVELYRPQKCLIYYKNKYIEKDVVVSFSKIKQEFECLLNVNLFI